MNVTEESMAYPLRHLLILFPAQTSVHTELIIDGQTIFYASLRRNSTVDGIPHDHSSDGAEAAYDQGALFCTAVRGLILITVLTLPLIIAVLALLITLVWILLPLVSSKERFSQGCVNLREKVVHQHRIGGVHTGGIVHEYVLPGFCVSVFHMFFELLLLIIGAVG